MRGKLRAACRCEWFERKIRSGADATAFRCLCGDEQQILGSISRRTGGSDESEGSLTLESGVLSRRPSPDAVLQGAINAGLEVLAQGLALELSPVRVNTVSPGMIVTPLWDGIPENKRQAMFEAQNS